MNAVISSDRLSKRFGRTQALRDLTLEIVAGSIYALTGANGAGKSTAIKALMNIVPPSAGTAAILGTDSRHLGPMDFARIGYVSENQDKPEWMTVAYFLKYLSAFYPTWDRDRADALIRQFALPLDRKLGQLSRGMWIKTALASSLAYRPALLVMDEPFGGLDPLVRDEVIEGLLDGAQEGETTILISSHDLAEIERFATHIGYLESGTLRFSEETGALSGRFREIEITLGGRAPDRRSAWPGHWLRPESSASVVRFIDSHFEADRTETEIREIFREVRQIDIHPMPLRSIFVALAREGVRA